MNEMEATEMREDEKSGVDGSGRRRTWMTIHALVVLALSGCTGDAQAEFMGACRTAGICAEPTPPPIVGDLLVDVSLGAPTSASVVSDDAGTLLSHAARRPGSIVRLWVLGAHLEDTVNVHTVTIPRFRGRSPRERSSEETRFVSTERARIATLIAPFFERPRPRNSPIVEGIARVAMADGYGHGRVLAVLTDGREVSSLLSADWECARLLPTVARFEGQLHARRLLEPGSLSGVEVFLARMSAPPVPGRSCPVGMARELHIRELLRSVLRTAGATGIEIETEALHLTTHTPTPTTSTGGH